MKILLFIFSLPLFAFGQLQMSVLKDSITEVNERCAREIEQATIDFGKGRFTVKLEKPIPFTNTQQKLLKKLYSVDVDYKNGWIRANYDCYNVYLMQLLRKKFEEDIFSITKTMADSLDRIGQGDMGCEFISKQGFQEYLKDNLPIEVSNELYYHYKNSNVFIEVNIGKKGIVESIEISPFDFSNQLRQAIYKTIKGKKLWTPRTDDGRPIKTQIIYPINFNTLKL